MNNLVKVMLACAAAVVTGKAVTKAAKANAEETLRNKEELLKFATREQKPDSNK